MTDTVVVTETVLTPEAEHARREREILEAGKEMGLAALDIARELLHGVRLDAPHLRGSLREFHAGLGNVLTELANVPDTVPPSSPMAPQDFE